MRTVQRLAVMIVVGSALAPAASRAEPPARDAVAQGESTYLALEHPTYEQRFEFQRWRAGLGVAADDSRYDPRKIANIHFLGADPGLGRKLLFPEDFGRSPCFTS